jgi:hypothetical protein
VLIKNSLTAVVVILLVGVLLAVGAACLPDNPYQRFQLLRGSLYQHLAWIYERIHYDPTPIDVAIVGPSKTLTGVSAGEVEQRLSVLGKSAGVTNLSIVNSGRNAQWAILDELYKAKCPRILVVAIDEKPPPWGHPWFMYFAPSVDVAFPPSMLLHSYLNNVSFLPFRQMELFAASLFPNFFGLRHAFDPVQYAKTRTDFTTSFRGFNGELVDMERQIPAAELTADHEEYKKTLHRSMLPRAFADIVEDIVEADDRVYLDEIARLALAHGTKLLLLYIPDFDSGKLDEKIREHDGKYGTILDYGDLATRNTLFSHWAHLNHAGAMIVSDRIADAVAPQL